MSRMQVAMLHAKTPRYERMLKNARRNVLAALNACQSWYAALSGGKDSTVAYALLKEQMPSAVAVTSTYKWRLPETTDYLNQISGLRYIASGSDHGTGWAKNWQSEAEAHEAFGDAMWLGNLKQGQAVWTQPEDGVMLGLRKDEAAYRRIHLCKMGGLYQSERHGRHWFCNPIADWSVLDVWAYIHSNNLNYNHAYDVMEKIGIPLDRQRVGPFAVDRALGYGQLAILKRGWPALFNEYATSHPEVRAYV